MPHAPFVITNADERWGVFSRLLADVKNECGNSVETYRSVQSDRIGTKIEVHVCLPDNELGRYATLFRIAFL